MGSEGIWGPVWGWSRRVDSGVDSGLILGHIWTISRKPHRKPGISLHLAVGRALRLNKAKYGSLEVYWWGTGIAPLQAHPHTHPGYTPPLPHSRLAGSPHELGTEE